MKTLVSLVVVLFSVWAWAQETSTSVGEAVGQPQQEEQLGPVDVQRQNAELQEIEITGSYIKRVDEEGTSPVTTIKSADLQQTGQNSISDVLRESAGTTQQTRPTSGNSNPGASTASIGIFNSSRILVLMDGQRVPKMGGQNSVDINMIPMAAIDRIEILKDGSSATYGADAIGGVMNFITKKNFSGGNFRLGQTSPTQGNGSQGDASVTFGKTGKKGSFMVSVEHKTNSHIADRDRFYSRMTNTATQGSPSSNFGTLTDLSNGAKIANANCPQNQLDTSDPARPVCRYDYTTESWSLPDTSQQSMLLTGSYKFNKYFKTRSTAMLLHRNVNTRYAPAPEALRLTSAQAATAGANGAWGNTGFTPAGAGNVILNYRLADDAGTRDGDDEVNTFNVSQKLYGKIAGSWTWDVTGSFGKSIRRNTGRGYGNREIIRQDIISGKYKPYAAPGQKGSLSEGALITAHMGQRSDQGGVKAVATGQLYQGGNIVGPIAWAFGGSANWQHYSQDVDAVTAAGNNWGGTGSNGIGSRAYQGIFQELSFFPTDSVEIGAATRFDHYNDFGTAFTPKLSVSWRPADNFMFRSSIGTGFRAPNLFDLYNGRGLGYPTVIDPTGAANGVIGAGIAQQYPVFTINNPNLKEETSTFFNTGFLAQPKKNWSFEANYFYAKIKNGVGAIAENDMLLQEKKLLDQGMTAGQVKAFFKDNYNIVINRAQGTGSLIDITAPSAFNIATLRLSGLDVSMQNEAQARVGNLPVAVVTRVEHIQFLGSESEDFPGLGMRAYRNIDWKNTVSLVGIHKAHSLRLAARTVSGGDKSANEFAVGTGSRPTYTEYDMQYTYGKLFGGAMSIGIRNVLDTNPPLDETVGSPPSQLNPPSQASAANPLGQKYDPIGRTFYGSYSYTF